MVNNTPTKCVIHGKHHENFPQLNFKATILNSSYNNDKLFLHLDNLIEYKSKKYNCAVATIRSKSDNYWSYDIIFVYIEVTSEVCTEKISELRKSWRGGLAGLAGISFLE